MQSAKYIWMLLAGLGIVALAYYPGLYGGFLLDDHANLGVLKQWVEGSILWQQVVFHNPSGPLGRPLSMSTFLANAAATGMSPWYFKLSNLLIHLACAGLIAGFLKNLLKHDPRMHRYALVAAIAVALWWALLPIHVSTVLYIVQRMAQLSVLFIFAGLWLYVVARNHLENGRRRGAWMLWFGVPALTALATLSKENGLLLPLLCLAVETGYFAQRGIPRSVKLFFAVTVVIPGFVIAGWLVTNPERLFVGYSSRDFGLYERVISQPRILWQYVFQILIPFGPKLGLFHDTYPHSTGLLTPITTIVAIFGWLGALLLAWMARYASPAIFTGLLLFLFGHAVESTILPLDLVFLHRNYGPSLGILLAVAGLFVLAAHFLQNTTPLFKRTIPLLVFMAALTLMSALFARALVWQSQDRLISQELKQNPNTVRTRLVAATYALQQGHPSPALYQVDAIEAFGNEADRGTVSIFKLIIYYCEAGVVPEKENVINQFSSPPPYIHTYALRAFELLTRRLEEGTCDLLKPIDIIPGAYKWLEATRQPGHHTLVWRFRYDLARLLLLSGNTEEALDLSLKAWQDSGHAFATGMLAFRIAAIRNDLETAHAVFDKLSERSDSPDLNKRIVISRFAEYLQSPNQQKLKEMPEAQLSEDPLN